MEVNGTPSFTTKEKVAIDPVNFLQETHTLCHTGLKNTHSSDAEKAMSMKNAFKDMLCGKILTNIVACVLTYIDTYILTFWDGKQNILTVSTICFLKFLLLDKRSVDIFMIPSKPINTQDVFSVRSMFIRAASARILSILKKILTQKVSLRTMKCAF